MLMLNARSVNNISLIHNFILEEGAELHHRDLVGLGWGKLVFPSCVHQVCVCYCSHGCRGRGGVAALVYQEPMSLTECLSSSIKCLSLILNGQDRTGAPIFRLGTHHLVAQCTWRPLLLHWQNGEHRHEETHWQVFGFTWRKGTKIPFSQGASSGYLASIGCRGS